MTTAAVLPGGVDTAFWQHALPGQVTPVDTFLQPRQVADAVAALLTMDEDVVPQELIIRATSDGDFAR